ncbi:MAG: DUF6116 family protein [Xanthomonadales bacterium]|nr:DUF6116 family protein [Xanthomonadales bacterium]
MNINPIRWLTRRAGTLRFPQLFLLTAAIFIIDLFIPDALPFVDEILLGLTTALLGSMKKRGEKRSSDE